MTQEIVLSNGTSLGNNSFGYDTNGSLTSQTSYTGDLTTYDFDARGRLAGATIVKSGVTTNTSYAYTADGLRAGETVNGVSTRYVVDEQSPSGYAQVIEEWATAGGSPALSASYVFGSGLAPISTTQVARDASGNVIGAQTGLFLSDGHSGPRQVVDATTAAVVRASQYDAFGNPVATAGAFQTPIDYRGQRLDPALGQYDLRARMYDPASGRFTGTDPEAGTYGDPLQLMRYGYAGANPVGRQDPSGREFSVSGMLSGISVGLAIASINPHAQGTGQDIALAIGTGISGLLGCSGTAAFRSIMGLPMGLALGAAVGFYGGFIAGYADALADDPLVSEDTLRETAIVSGILGAIQGILAFGYLGRGAGACFTAGTPLLTPDGSKAIEQLKVGDRVLARDEYDPAGPVEAKRVEELFVYESQVLYLTVGGRRIGTTSEHPFYVPARREWVPAKELRPGDELVGHDGRQVIVEVIEAGAWETVYNFRVQDHHTYFVGCDEWGFSVWAHNICLYHGTRTPIPQGGLNLAAATANQRAGTPTPGIYFADSMRRAVPHAGPNGWVVRVDAPPLIAVIMARPSPTDATITDYVADTPGLVAYLNAIMKVLPVRQAIIKWGLI